MKIEVGKRYVTRNGNRTRKMEMDPGYDRYPFTADVETRGSVKRCTWTPTGEYYRDLVHDLDLVAEYTGPDFTLVEECAEDKKEEKEMKIDLGKRYVTRDGSITGKMGENTSSACLSWPFRAYIEKPERLYQCSKSWAANGNFIDDGKSHSLDLVAEYVEPALPKGCVSPIDREKLSERAKLYIHSSGSFVQDLASKHKSRAARLMETDEGFANKARELAEKLAYALLLDPTAVLKRRKSQSPMLWEAAVCIIGNMGVMLAFDSGTVYLES